MKNIILLGDSITEWNPLEHEGLINLGIHGNTTEDIWLRIEEVEKSNGYKLIFKAGINDVLKKFSLEKSREYYEKISDVLKNKFEETIFLSVLPIERRKKINAKVRNLNRIIKETADNNKIKFIDVHHLFCDENLNLKKEYSSDGIHLSEEGYEVLNREILKLI